MEEEQIGILRVSVRSGFGIYPIGGAYVTVEYERGEGGIAAQTYTDRSGNTPWMLLTTADEPKSRTLEPVGATFTVRASKDGYQTVVMQGVTVYPGVGSELKINLAPLPDRPGKKPLQYDLEQVYDPDGNR